jgi:Tfp pilus assembly protein FimT
MRNREAGKFGVELAIVLMIIGIVAVFIIPQVADVLEVNRNKGAAEQVASLMRLARQYAISTGVQYDVRLTPTTVQVACTTGVAGCPGTLPTEPLTTVIHDATLVSADGTTLDGSSANAIKFDRTGGALALRDVVVRYDGPQDRFCSNVTVSVPGRIVQTAPNKVALTSACP